MIVIVRSTVRDRDRKPDADSYTADDLLCMPSANYSNTRLEHEEWTPNHYFKIFSDHQVPARESSDDTLTCPQLDRLHARDGGRGDEMIAYPSPPPLMCSLNAPIFPRLRSTLHPLPPGPPVGRSCCVDSATASAATSSRASSRTNWARGMA